MKKTLLFMARKFDQVKAEIAPRVRGRLFEIG